MDKKTKTIIQITTTGILVAGGIIALILLLKNCTNQKQDKGIEIGNIDKLDLKLNDANPIFSSSFSVKYSDGSYIEKPEFSFSPELPLGLSLNVLEEEGEVKIQGNSTSEIEEQGGFRTYKLIVNDGKGIKAEKDFKLRCLAFCIPDSPIKFQGVKSDNLFCEVVENTGEEPFAVIENDEGSPESIEAENLVIPNYVKVEGKEDPVPVIKIKDETFKDANLTGSLTIGENIEEIGKKAFEGCSGLNSTIKFGHKVKHIKESAFKNCTSFAEELIIPESVEEIGTGAFKDCNFSSIDIQNSTHFQWADNVGSAKILIPKKGREGAHFNYESDKPIGGIAYGHLIIPEGTVIIGNGIFEDCNKLTGELIIPESVEEIGDEAFSDCNFSNINFQNSSNFQWADNVGDAKVLIPKKGRDNAHFLYESDKPAGGIAYGHLEIQGNPSAIGPNAFENCNKLTGELIIPESVEIIGLKAFSGCVGLTGLTVAEENLKTINEQTFYGCRNLSGPLIIGANVTIIGDNAFSECNNFTSLKFSLSQTTQWGNNIFSGWKTRGNPIVINSSGNGWQARDFAITKGLGLNWVGGDYGLWDGSDWAGHEHLNGTLICTKEDEGLSAYAEIDSVQNEYEATDLVIPDYVKFSNDEVFPLKIIKERAFYQKEGLEGNLTIGNNITNIGDSAFYECENLDGNLNLDSELTNIGNNAFSQCLNLTGDLIIPEPVNSIGDSAFSGCAKLNQKLFIGKNVETIGTKAFANCDFSNVEVDSENSHFQLANNVGNECYVLIPKDEEHLDGKFKYESDKPLNGVAYGHLVIPYGTTMIGISAFEDCSGLKSLLDVKYCKHICEDAFCHCENLSGALELDGGQDDQIIDSQAFAYCSKFDTLAVERDDTNAPYPSAWSDDIFIGWSSDTNDVYVCNTRNIGYLFDWPTRDFAITKGLGLNWVGGDDYKEADGSNWTGRVSGTLTCKKEGTGSSAYATIISYDDFESTGLVLPKYVRFPNLEVLPLRA